MGNFVDDHGVPHINGKPAMRCLDDDPLVRVMGGALAPWLCPECRAHLGSGMICLNGCHMTVAAMRRFDAMLAEAGQRVDARDDEAKKAQRRSRQ